MFGNQYPQQSNGLDVGCLAIGLLAVVAIVGGAYLGGSELLNPSLHAAKTDKLKAEAAALREKTAYESRKHDLELTLAEEKAALELETLQERRARQLELVEPLAIALTVIVCLGILIVAMAGSYCLILWAKQASGQRAGLRRERSPPSPVPKFEQGPRQGTERKHAVDHIAGVRVDPFRVTYDGLLAYVYEALNTNGADRFYPKGIKPEVEDAYLQMLEQTHVVKCYGNGQSAYVLRQQIKDLDDVELRIPRQSFEVLSRSYHGLKVSSGLVPLGRKIRRDTNQTHR